MKTKTSKQKSKKLFCVLLAIILVFAIIVGGAFLWLLSHYNKNNNLILFQPENKTQEIYILGTIHAEHFNKLYDYSMANVQSVIDTIQPDILLIEVRQDTVEKYAALDGPIEMIFAWCYAKENGIEVMGIDWWQVTEDAKSNYTDAERDNHIFDNILSKIEGKQKVLVICGATHRVEQGKRFISNGYNQNKLQNIKQYFDKVSNDDFTYPKTMAVEIQQKIEYIKTGFVDEINAKTEEGSTGQKNWLQKTNDMEVSLNTMLTELIIPNKLYKK